MKLLKVCICENRYLTKLWEPKNDISVVCQNINTQLWGRWDHVTSGNLKID